MQLRLRRLWLAAGVGLCAGLATALFLGLLDFVTSLRESHIWLMWLLPVVGLIVALIYDRYGQKVHSGHNLILDEIHEPKQVIPLRMAPLVFVGTLLSHLVGASVGREGTAIQMGGALADQFGRFFRLSANERQMLLVTGMGAGFGAAIGAPWAGALFGMEVLRVGRLKLFAPVECVLASFIGYGTTLLFRDHADLPNVALPAPEAASFFFVILAGIIFGSAAHIFVKLAHGIEALQKKWISRPFIRPVFGGLLLLTIFLALDSQRYAGLGLPVIHESFQRTLSLADPLWKTLLTALSVGSGFKGGEFTPLVFVGSSLGSALSEWLPFTPMFLAALGYAAVFAGAANTPLACSVMAAEIFGFQVLPYALLTCLTSYLVSARHGIYRGQKLESRRL